MSEQNGNHNQLLTAETVPLLPKQTSRASSAAEPVYRISALTHRYGKRSVLQIPEMTIQRGEILALVGPSGAGKSTLLRLLNFLETPTNGSLHYCGHTFVNHTAIPLEQRRQIAMVFQRPVLRSTTVLKNAADGLRLRRVADAQQRATVALERIGLGHLLHKPARTLSGGEMQRVALTRATLIEPEVLLLDEPTANLDPYNIRLIEDTVLELHQRRGTTIVLVTHNIFQARRLAQRVALLMDGQIVEHSSAHAFFESPADPRTGAFLRGDIIY